MLTDTKTIDQSVGVRLRERREALGLRQGDVAERVGCCRQQITKYESGINSLTTERMIALAVALDVSVMFFLSGVSAAHDREHRIVARLRSMPPRKRSEAVRAFEASVNEAPK